MQTAEVNEQDLEDLYAWIDEIPLTRPKKDMKRDFSDGVLVAEVVKHYNPHLVDLHNYSPALAVAKKTVNWHILNRKIFKKLGFELSDDVIQNLTNCKPWAMERFLLMLRLRLISPQSASLSRSVPHSLGSDNMSVDKVNQANVSAYNSPSSGISNSTIQQRSKVPLGVASHAPQVQPPHGAGQQGSINASTGYIHSSAAAAGTGSDMVPRALLDERIQELLAKDETIQILQAKIRRFEHLLQLKDIRIEDLQTRLVQLSDGSSSAQQQQQSTVKNGTTTGRVKQPIGK